MSERVKAKTCTFAELLKDCFVNFKDSVFQYRLRIACERATEVETCFLDSGHKKRFYEGVSYMRKKDPKFIAQLYLLSASELLWIKAKRVIVFQTIYNKVKKQSNKEAFPLLPFISTGLMIGYFI